MKCYFCQHELQTRDSFTFQYCQGCESLPGIRFAATSDDKCFLRFYIDKVLYGWFVYKKNNRSELKGTELWQPPILSLPFMIDIDPNTVAKKTQLYITFS